MMTLWHSLYYLGNLCKIFLTRNGFEDFENIVDIWLLKFFMKLLRSELCVLNTLTYELLMWFFPCAMTLVMTSSVWRLRLCDDPAYVTTTLVWRPCHVALGEVSSFEMVLDIFYSSQWIIYSFIVILGSLVLHYFYQSYCVVEEIYFAEFKWKFPNYCMFCKMLIIIKLAFPPPY